MATKVTRVSFLTGIEHEREIQATPEQITQWEKGAWLHEALPDTSADDREFLLSGITPEEWDNYVTKYSQNPLDASIH